MINQRVLNENIMYLESSYASKNVGELFEQVIKSIIKSKIYVYFASYVYDRFINRLKMVRLA
jgi:hypothetical protein